MSKTVTHDIHDSCHRAEKDAVEVMGVTPETFQQSLVAHQDSREVRMILQAMHVSCLYNGTSLFAII